jgi:hypothetical protein
MKCSKWPFKTLKKTSSSSIAPLAVSMGLAVLALPPEKRSAAAARVVGLALKLGARLALEFDVPPMLFVEMAKGSIVKEGGAAAAEALKVGGASKTLFFDPEAEKIVEALFAMADLPGGDA